MSAQLFVPIILFTGNFWLKLYYILGKVTGILYYIKHFT